jgi:hypothetical protein
MFILHTQSIKFHACQHMLVRLGTCQGSLSSICIIKKSIDQVSFKNVVFTLSNILINILMKMLWLFIQNIFCVFFLQLTVLWLFSHVTNNTKEMIFNCEDNLTLFFRWIKEIKLVWYSKGCSSNFLENIICEYIEV